MSKKIRMNTKRMVTLDGMMTYGKLGNGLTVADFQNYDPEVEVEPVAGKFKGRLMHDGNLYLEQLPRRTGISWLTFVNMRLSPVARPCSGPVTNGPSASGCAC